MGVFVREPISAGLLAAAVAVVAGPWIWRVVTGRRHRAARRAA